MRQRFLWWILVPVALAALLAMLAVARPGLLRAWNPFAPLAVGDPVTPATGIKLARAARDPAYCRAALDTAPLRTEPIPDGGGDAACPLHAALRVNAGSVRLNSSFPASCPLALAYALFETHDLQPLAKARLGAPVALVAHLGSYACTPGSRDAAAADYASASALDIAGFILADGRSIAIKRDWQGRDAQASAFLHDLRDAACRRFGTVASPDAGAAHAGYLHVATRTGGGCR